MTFKEILLGTELRHHIGAREGRGWREMVGIEEQDFDND